jgi:hypothetical protein
VAELLVGSPTGGEGGLGGKAGSEGVFAGAPLENSGKGHRTADDSITHRSFASPGPLTPLQLTDSSVRPIPTGITLR